MFYIAYQNMSEYNLNIKLTKLSKLLYNKFHEQNKKVT